MKTRFISEQKKHPLICTPGLSYILRVHFTNLYFPCPFRLITGLKCPGCGITHMIVALFRFDFKNAFLANPLLFTMLPFAAVIYISNKVHYVRTGIKKRYSKRERIIEYILLSLVLIFWIIRNIQMTV